MRAGRMPVAPSAALSLALIVMASCSANSRAVAPNECPQGVFLATVQTYVPGSAFIDTPWEPAPDTDLAAALDARGVACSYGIQEAEIGTTILWAQGADAFPARRHAWKAGGQEQVMVDGADEAWALRDSAGTERHLWAVNLLVDDVWIQVNATFLRDLDEARPLIDAAIAVVRTSQ